MIHPDNAASILPQALRPGGAPSAERLGFTSLRDDMLLGAPVTVYAAHRPAAS